MPQEGSSVFALFSLIKLHLASLPLASSYSRVAVSSVFWAQNIYFSAQTRGAPLTSLALNLGGNVKIFRWEHWLCVCVCVFFPFILDIKFVGRNSRGHTGGSSHRIFHPPSFCGACLNFSREKDSAITFPRRPCEVEFCVKKGPVLTS